MGYLMKKYMLTFLLALGMVHVAQAAATKFTDVRIAKTLVVDGAVTAGSVNCSNVSTTTLTAADLIATNGVKSSTAAFTNSTMAVTVSSATASTASLCIGGAFAALPTTGFNQGCLVYDTADQKLYVSTQTVVGTFSWKSVGSQ